METTSEVYCDTSIPDNNEDQDNTEAQGENKETKPAFSWTDEEDQKRFINILQHSLDQALRREIHNCLTNKQENLDQNNTEDQEMDDNLLSQQIF